MPNKHMESFGKMFDGHLLESETYVGGHVEALQAGVYRSDIPNNFAIIPETAQQLIDDLDAALKFSIEVEGNLKMDDVVNYEEVGHFHRSGRILLHFMNTILTEIHILVFFRSKQPSQHLSWISEIGRTEWRTPAFTIWMSLPCTPISFSLTVFNPTLSSRNRSVHPAISTESARSAIDV